jgi:hypothetical protein
MSYTREQLITAALQEIVALGVGRTITDEDKDHIDLRIEAIVADLAARDIYAVGDAGEVGPTGGDFEPAAYLHLARFVAAEVSRGFGVPYDEAMQARAERRLRTLSRIGRGTGKNLDIDPSLLTYPKGWGFNFTRGQ